MAILVNYTGVEGSFQYIKGIERRMGGRIDDVRVSIYPTLPNDKLDAHFDELVKTFTQYEFKLDAPNRSAIVVDEQNQKTYTCKISLSDDALVLQSEIESHLKLIGVNSDFWNAYDIKNNFLTTSEC